mmetsp:Transcript_22460/g.36953  ORF Transcript_22460/g.36953 Transcript_22460/m.36953 type:complete len:207 (-) Transcript_22460:54-674(-)
MAAQPVTTAKPPAAADLDAKRTAAAADGPVAAGGRWAAERPPPLGLMALEQSAAESVATVEQQATGEARSQPHAPLPSNPPSVSELWRVGSSRISQRKSERAMAASLKVSSHEPELVTPSWPLMGSSEGQSRVCESVTPVWPKISTCDSEQGSNQSEHSPRSSLGKGRMDQSPARMRRSSPRMRAMIKCNERRLRSSSPSSAVRGD